MSSIRRGSTVAGWWIFFFFYFGEGQVFPCVVCLHILDQHRAWILPSWNPWRCIFCSSLPPRMTRPQHQLQPKAVSAQKKSPTTCQAQNVYLQSPPNHSTVLSAIYQLTNTISNTEALEHNSSSQPSSFGLSNQPHGSSRTTAFYPAVTTGHSSQALATALPASTMGRPYISSAIGDVAGCSEWRNFVEGGSLNWHSIKQGVGSREYCLCRLWNRMQRWYLRAHNTLLPH